ncbi:MAG TPA: hypothetical protein VML55_21040 [Planctomycetaceae bacterium]|nr:hypothetical protein [Planctomycetaceae bacterium]
MACRRPAGTAGYGLPLVGLVLLAGCTGERAADERPARRASTPATAPPIEAPGLENLRRVSDRVYSGGEPKGPGAYRELARLGVRTVVSVDGARPDLEAARAAGLRYVHIPIGYDGVPPEAAASLARLARDLVGQAADQDGASAGPPSEIAGFGQTRVEGPIYVHCHHGKHRGPAAAAIVCIAAGEADAASALRILEEAGTSRDYSGLWRDVAAFSPPAAEAKLPELAEVAQVNSLAAAMAAIDRAFDNLTLCRGAGWTTPAGHPDLVPAREALLLTEGFREALRHLSGEYDERFSAWLAESESAGAALAAALEHGARGEASKLLTEIGGSCKRCHGEYRD